MASKLVANFAPRLREYFPASTDFLSSLVFQQNNSLGNFINCINNTLNAIMSNSSHVCEVHSNAYTGISLYLML